MDASEFIDINVGGFNFKATLDNMTKFPKTRLGRIFKLHGKNGSHLIFDRNPTLFPYILDFYRMGELHLPSNMCGAIIKEELEYWEIEREHIADCCLEILLKFEGGIQTRTKIIQNLDKIELDYTEEECQKSKHKQLLRKIWLLLDRPQSSRLAYLYSIVFFLVTTLSVFLLCCNSHPAFRIRIISYDELLHFKNTTELYDYTDINNPKHVMYATTILKPMVYITELACLAFFTLDLIFHFAACPIKRRFFRHFMNCLDCFLVPMMWIVVVMEITGVYGRSKTWITIYSVFKCFSIFRLFRLFRLLKQHTSLNILCMAVRASCVEFLLLFTVILMTSVFFANFVYYADIASPTTFPDVFTAIWWAIVTITTVGYGDMYPETFAGKAVGSICTTVGLMIIALPIAIIVTNFSDFYSKNKVRENRKRGNRSGQKPTKLNQILGV